MKQCYWPHFFLFLHLIVTFSFSLNIPYMYHVNVQRTKQWALRKSYCLNRFPSVVHFLLTVDIEAEWTLRSHFFNNVQSCFWEPSLCFIFLLPALSADLIDCLFLSHIFIYSPISAACFFLALPHGSPHLVKRPELPNSSVFGLSPLGSILHTTKIMAFQQSQWCMMGRISPTELHKIPF